MEWIKVDGYKNIPEGTWLTMHEPRNGDNKGEMQVTKIFSNGMGVSGTVFSFDLPKITHYKQLPKPPVNS